MPDIKHFDPDVALAVVERLFWQHGMAPTSMEAVATTTGLNRSSLYATYGGKKELFRAALRRYVRHRAQPALRDLAEDGRGLPSVRDFFAGLIEERCSGDHAGWGCMLVNAYAGVERDDPEVRALLDEHHQNLREAFHAALVSARQQGQLAEGAAIEATAEMLVLLAYGVNLRSRAGVDAVTLHDAVTANLALLQRPRGPGPD